MEEVEYRLPKTMKAFVMKQIGEVGFVEKPIPQLQSPHDEGE